MNPDDITLEATSKLFLYEKHSRDIESITNLDTLKQVARCFLKLYLKQQETLECLKMPNVDFNME